MKMELIEGSETSAIRTQTPGNYPKENTLLPFWPQSGGAHLYKTIVKPFCHSHYVEFSQVRLCVIINTGVCAVTRSSCRFECVRSYACIIMLGKWREIYGYVQIFTQENAVAMCRAGTVPYHMQRRWGRGNAYRSCKKNMILHHCMTFFPLVAIC